MHSLVYAEDSTSRPIIEQSGTPAENGRAAISTTGLAH
jgi:hypothetical protein